MMTVLSKRTPPLQAGDHLTREEFERRYEAMPNVKKAELIEGEVYMPSPVRWGHHASPHARVVGWLLAYELATPGTQVGDNGSARLDAESEPQPDAALIILPSHGGQSSFSEDGYLQGAPELVVEVAVSRVSIDLHRKLRMYQANGVREYVVWRVEDQQVDWFVFREGLFVAATADAAGHFRSTVFPGLWLDANALVAGNLAGVMAVLQQGIATPEHAAFVQQLAQVAAG